MRKRRGRNRNNPEVVDERVAPRPDITLFSDASFYIGNAGYGVWMKGGGRTSLSAGGPIKRICKTSQFAEACAIANGLWILVNRYRQPHETVVMVQSDSATALVQILLALPEAIQSAHASGLKLTRRCKTKPHPAYAAVMGQIRAIVDQHGLTLVVRHVKGHRPDDGGRGAVNALCDRLAKAGRRKAEEIHLAHIRSQAPALPDGEAAGLPDHAGLHDGADHGGRDRMGPRSGAGPAARDGRGDGAGVERPALHPPYAEAGSPDQDHGPEGHEDRDDAPVGRARDREDEEAGAIPNPGGLRRELARRRAAARTAEEAEQARLAEAIVSEEIEA